MDSSSACGARPVAHRPIFDPPGAEFIEKNGREPFVFRHGLAQSELFELARLEELAKAILVWENAGRARDAQIGCSTAPSGRLRREDQLVLAFRALGDRDAAVRFKFSSANEVDPAYEEIMRQTIEEIAELMGLPLSEISWSGLTIFVSSPGAETPFHSDLELNYLFQIAGDKEVRLYDQRDPFIVPQTTIEQLNKGDPGAARYRDEYKDRGEAYRIEPGTGVHHPPLAPHSLAVGENVSVSAAISFSTKSMDVLARVHQANWCLRHFGFKPRSPDLSRAADRFKAELIHQISGPRDSYSGLFRGISRLTWPARAGRFVLKDAHARWAAAMRSLRAGANA